MPFKNQRNEKRPPQRIAYRFVSVSELGNRTSGDGTPTGRAERVGAHGMPLDGLEDEEILVQLTRYAPAVVILVSMILLGVPYAIAIGIALIFAVIGFFSLFLRFRITVAVLTLVAALSWSFTSVEIKQMVLSPFGS
jgi:hypothetical protein